MTAYHWTPEAKDWQRGLMLYRWRKRREAEPMPPRWARISAMRSSGMTKAAIAREMSVSHQRIGQILKKIEGRTP